LVIEPYRAGHPMLLGGYLLSSLPAAKQKMIPAFHPSRIAACSAGLAAAFRCCS
jgi:hypothetical protein